MNDSGYLLDKILTRRHRRSNQKPEISPTREVFIRWSDVLVSAFKHYHLDFLTAWALNETRYNNVGDKILIDKESMQWASWKSVAQFQRPDIATLYDLMPDLPTDEEYAEIIKDLVERSISRPEDYFWENMFTYNHANEVVAGGKKYSIVWVA